MVEMILYGTEHNEVTLMQQPCGHDVAQKDFSNNNLHK